MFYISTKNFLSSNLEQNLLLVNETLFNGKNGDLFQFKIIFIPLLKLEKTAGQSTISLLASLDLNQNCEINGSFTVDQNVVTSK